MCERKNGHVDWKTSSIKFEDDDEYGGDEDGNEEDVRWMNEKISLRAMGAWRWQHHYYRVLFWHYMKHRTRSPSEL